MLPFQDPCRPTHFLVLRPEQLEIAPHLPPPRARFFRWNPPGAHACLGSDFFMVKMAELKMDGKCSSLPVIEGTEQELAIDISALRSETGFITLDDGYANTGSCKSSITFIDGERGILRYRGI